MKIIKASYEIEAAPGYFEWCTKHIEKAIRTCYKSEDKICEGSDVKLIDKILTVDSGGAKHVSTIEHAAFSVRFIIDRGVSHELVRHRLASYSQESTRYCNYNKDKFNNEITVIQPCWFEGDLTGSYGNSVHLVEKAALRGVTQTGNLDKQVDCGVFRWASSMMDAESAYFALLGKQGGWTPQRARAVLPNSLKTEVVMTANLREWRTVFELRTAKRAHPQIREVMIPLLEEMKTILPAIFSDIEVQ